MMIWIGNIGLQEQATQKISRNMIKGCILSRNRQ